MAAIAARFFDRYKFLLFAILIHSFYLLSVLHIYFRSPILEGLSVTPSLHKPPGKRVVLLVADGLQADKAFHRKYKNDLQFIRNVAEEQGTWGVSHTRVPTESRVGHVSLIAGTYEDVSAITNGWKDNPVEFDSAFKQSRNTWCWGSPEILAIFDKGKSKNIHSNSYNPDQIDFSEKDASKLDQWVFDEVTSFFKDANNNVHLKTQLHQSGIIFFLHLLGIDTTGHAKKPDSPEYQRNVAYVDEGIRNITQVIEQFYDNDGKTSFILTSDHGMTPWGAHGTGLQSETETPFLAWGSGIKKPVIQHSVNRDLQSSVWGLEDFQRYDLNQVDVASLITFLIGVSYPVNSVGILPHKILNMTLENTAKGIYANMKQILVQYYAHEIKVKRNSLIFKEYQHADKVSTAHVDTLHENQNYNQVINDSLLIINEALRGIQYYHGYNKLFFSIMANIAFISWILFTLIDTMVSYTGILQKGQISRRSHIFDFIFMIILSIFFMIYLLRSADITDMIYTFAPLVFSWILLRNKISNIQQLLVSLFKDISMSFVFQIFIVLVGVELVVLSFFQRKTLSIIGLTLSILPWFHLLNKTKQNKSDFALCIIWTIVSVLSATFPMLPVITREEMYLYVFIASFIVATFGVIYSFLFKSRDGSLIGLITLIFIVCVVVKMHTIMHIKHHGNKLPFLNQVISWLALLFLPLLSMFTTATTVARLLAVNMSLFSIYMLMSISYEALFLLFLNIQLSLWILMEMKIFQNHTIISYDKQQQQQRRNLTIDDLRIAFMFLYFIFFAFFGTGNIASINSFDIPSTYCFQTVFNPLIQGFILGLKVLLPFICVVLYFRSLQSVRNIPTYGLFSVILLLTDLMALNFFFMVKDEGSWLDVGQSVSHFIITLAFIVFLLPIYELSYYICGTVKIEATKQHTM